MPVAETGEPGRTTGGLKAVIRGRVQGVGFRWFVRQVARRLGLAGWVTNQSDGSVLVLAAGSPGELERLTEALRMGPPGAWVEGVAIESLSTPEDLPHPFQIK